MAADPKKLIQELSQGNQAFMKKNLKFGRAFAGAVEEASKDGALSRKVKELIFTALSLNQQCEYCIAHHATEAMQAGATEEEVYEAAQVAVAMGGGPTWTYAVTLLRETVESFSRK